MANRIISDKQIDEMYQAFQEGVLGLSTHELLEKLVSKQEGNRLVLLEDGLYIKSESSGEGSGSYSPEVNPDMEKIMSAIDFETFKREIASMIASNMLQMNEKYDSLYQLIEGFTPSDIEQDIEAYEGTKDELTEVVNIYNIYEDQVIIIDFEIMVENTSDEEDLNIVIKEHGIQTIDVVINPKEVQKYKITNIPNVNILTNGSYSIYTTISYVRKQDGV